MRKIIISCALIVLLLFTFITIKVGAFGIHSYSDLKNKNEETEMKLDELTTLKATKYASSEKNLKTTVSKHIEIKKKYDQVSSTKTEEQKVEALTGGDYDLSYIWVTLGNYATDNQCDLNIEVYQNTDTSDDESYAMCDLKFTIVSSYDGAIEFINKVTSDNELGFIPENLKMHSEYQTVKTVAEDQNQVITTKRLMLVTEFYKTNMPISRTSLLKVENEETTEE